jgi:hypothetical protein
MAPILGIIASANQGQFISYNDYEPIATVTVGAGGASTISFTSIPSTYQHLQLRAFLNTSSGNTNAARFNGDTGNSYSTHFFSGNGSIIEIGRQANHNALSSLVYSSDVSNIFFGGVVDILDYANTNKNKTIRSLAGWDTNGGGSIHLRSFTWYSTSAVNSITITSDGGNFTQYSSYALYGIKG